MNSKPLAYDSLKTVLQYMDPNPRFLLFSRIASIRTAERAVPLKIDTLSFGAGKHCISVNKTDYEIALYQMDCKDKIPYLISGTSKLNSKMTCNVDEFGTRDYITKAGGMLPGDIGKNLFGYYDSENLPTNEDRLQKLEGILEIEKQRLKEELELFKKLKKTVEGRKDRIREMENELVLFRNKSNNIRPKFEIHLTKSQDDSPPNVIERVNSTGDLHKAEESLMKFMFSKRRHVVVIRTFVTYQQCPLRLPTDSRMKIKNMTIGRRSTSNIKLMKSIVDKSCLPLERLTVFNENSPKLDYEFLGNFKHLELYLPEDSFPRIKNLRNTIVHFPSVKDSFFKNEGFIRLIKKWMETNKPIGTHFIFDVAIKESDAIQVLNRVRHDFNEATADNKCIYIPMKTPAILKISYIQFSCPFGIFRMAVLPVE